MTNYISILIITIVIIFSMSSFVAQGGVFIQIILMIGGFLFVLSGSQYISRLLGVDSGTGDTLAQVAHLRQAVAGAGRGVKRAFGTAGRAIGSAGRTLGSVAAGATYGLGRAMGGVGIGDTNGGGFFGSGNDSSSPFGAGLSGPNMNAFNQQGGSQENFKMNNTNDLKTNLNEATNNNLNQGSSFERQPQNENSFGGPTMEDIKNHNIGRSYDNSFSANLNDKISQMTGLKGGAAKGASAVAGHVYARSMNRTSKSRGYRAAQSLSGVVRSMKNTNYSRLSEGS